MTTQRGFPFVGGPLDGQIRPMDNPPWRLAYPVLLGGPVPVDAAPLDYMEYAYAYYEAEPFVDEQGRKVQQYRFVGMR